MNNPNLLRFSRPCSLRNGVLYVESIVLIEIPSTQEKEPLRVVPLCSRILCSGAMLLIVSCRKVKPTSARPTSLVIPFTIFLSNV